MYLYAVKQSENRKQAQPDGALVCPCNGVFLYVSYTYMELSVVLVHFSASPVPYAVTLKEFEKNQKKIKIPTLSASGFFTVKATLSLDTIAPIRLYVLLLLYDGSTATV